MAGVVLIYFIVTRLPASFAKKNIIFFLLGAPWWPGPVSFGLNYTPLRFFLAPALCLFAIPQISAEVPSMPRAVVTLAASEALLLLVSPEQAIAFCCAIGLFIGLASLRDRSSRLLTLFAGFASSSFVMLFVSSHWKLFLTLRAMSLGGYNFPLLPVVQHLPILALLMTAACVFVNSIRSRMAPSRFELLILLALFSLPAAFGRCDIGHFYLNSTSAVIAAWFVLAQYPRLFQRTAGAFVLLVALFPAPILLFSAVKAQRLNRSTVLVPPEPAESGPTGGQSLSLTDSGTEPLPFAPFGRPLPNSSRLSSVGADTGYFNGLELVTLPYQVEQKIDELRALPNRDLLVPSNFSCHYALDRHRLRRILVTPYVPPARRSSEIWQPLCDYIHENYQRSTQPSGLRSYWRLSPNGRSPHL